VSFEDSKGMFLDDVYEGADISILVQDLNGGYANSKTYHLKKGLFEDSKGMLSSTWFNT